MSIDVRGVNGVQVLLADIRGLRPTITYRSINKTVDKTKTLVSKKVREQIALKAGYVGGRLTTEKANRDKLSGRVIANRRGILLSRFTPKRLTQRTRTNASRLSGYPALSDSNVTIAAIAPGKKPKAMTYRIKPSGSRKTDKFFALRLSNGVIGVAVRTGQRKKDYKVIYGPSVSQVFNTLKPEIEPIAADEYLIQFASQLDYELNRLAQ